MLVIKDNQPEIKFNYQEIKKILRKEKKSLQELGDILGVTREGLRYFLINDSKYISASMLKIIITYLHPENLEDIIFAERSVIELIEQDVI